MYALFHIRVRLQTGGFPMSSAGLEEGIMVANALLVTIAVVLGYLVRLMEN